MRLAIAGGGLQGVEAAWLAAQAGWGSLLIDRRPDPPAKLLAGSFRQLDLLKAPPEEIAELCRGFAAVLPALEDQAAIDRLAGLARSGLIPPVAIDPEAYRLSASKPLSKDIFRRLGLPAAEDWRPGAKGAFVAKPASLSGSRGVRYFGSAAELEAALPDEAARQGLVIERRALGPQYSIEVTAKAGLARAWQVTRLEMDELSDCRLVEAPADLGPALENSLKAMAVAIAAEIGLTGLMDLEAVLQDGEWVLLEIDARLPSQTPTAVHLSTGVNLLAELLRCFVEVESPAPPAFPPQAARRAVYEHVRSRSGAVTRHGEHVMGSMGPLSPRPGLLGAELALAAGGPDDFVATLMRLSPL
jgi:pyrrolysine biosynthesis protein PylC